MFVVNHVGFDRNKKVYVRLIGTFEHCYQAKKAVLEDVNSYYRKFMENKESLKNFPEDFYCIFNKNTGTCDEYFVKDFKAEKIVMVIDLD